MRFLFYARRNLHPPHLEPIRKWFDQHLPGCETAYTAPPYVPASEGMPGIGLTEPVIQGLKQSGASWIDIDKAGDWQPDATILADADFATIHWGGIIVNVNHGLICKGTFYTNSPVVQRENRADLICVPGSHHAEILSRVLTRPVIPTGLVKFDPIGRGEMTRQTERTRLQIPDSAKVVLFAPTYNLDLSAVPVIKDGIRYLAKEGVYVIVKLHGMSPASWQELYKLLSITDEKIIYADSNDITPCIVASDVVISDVSSAFMEAAALNRPVILVNNPLQKQFHLYNPRDIEYAWRDIGIETNSLEMTLNTTLQCLENPTIKADKRREYGPLLVGQIDGKAAERAARSIVHFLENPI